MNKADHIILGIDPGTVIMGFAVIAVQGNKPSLLVMDVLKLASHKDVYVRLRMIHEKVCALIAEYRPTQFAIEAPFFGKNVQSMLKLGRAQGVAIAAAMQASITINEYAPKKIKQSITGNGNAEKEQVWKMLQYTLALEQKPQYFDATDALAVALCHHYNQSTLTLKAGKAFNGWEDFAAKNKDRIL